MADCHSIHHTTAAVPLAARVPQISWVPISVAAHLLHPAEGGLPDMTDLPVR